MFRRIFKNKCHIVVHLWLVYVYLNYKNMIGDLERWATIFISTITTQMWTTISQFYVGFTWVNDILYIQFCWYEEKRRKFGLSFEFSVRIDEARRLWFFLFGISFVILVTKCKFHHVLSVVWYKVFSDMLNPAYKPSTILQPPGGNYCTY